MEQAFNLNTQRYEPSPHFSGHPYVGRTEVLRRANERTVITLTYDRKWPERWVGIDNQGRIFDRNMPHFWQERGTLNTWQNEADLRRR